MTECIVPNSSEEEFLRKLTLKFFFYENFSYFLEISMVWSCFAFFGHKMVSVWWTMFQGLFWALTVYCQTYRSRDNGIFLNLTFQSQCFLLISWWNDAQQSIHAPCELNFNPIFNIQDSFEILRTWAFQNCPWWSN